MTGVALGRCAAVLGLAAAAAARPAVAAGALRIGSQKGGSLAILRRQGTLEAMSAPCGEYAVQPVDAGIIAQQQGIADTFARLRIIPARIDVRRIVWMPPGA